MAVTYEPIATTTLGSAASSITFSSIPATYTDLKIIFVARSARSNLTDQPRLQYNADTGANYSRTVLRADGSIAESFRNTGQTYIIIGSQIPAATASSGLFGFIELDIFSYAGSTFKTLFSSDSGDMNGSGYVDRIIGLWRSTDAITSIKLYAEIGNLDTGTTATLYGIKAA